MITFVIGVALLLAGGAYYGRLCEKAFGPDGRETPAYTKRDGVDYVPMPKWKNSLINLLNIAGTGPILGPIQGALFGPAALLAIPVGCVIGGAMHDYFCGMIAARDGGEQMPEMVRRYTDPFIHKIYTVFVCLTLFLVGVVFIYTPGDIAATQVFGFGGTAKEASTWVIYSVIFAYYLIAAVFPIDKIIGRVYPVFGALLLLSAAGIFVMLFAKGYSIPELWQPWTAGGFDFAAYFRAGRFIPNFFVTVACGILSGFHATQTVLVSRTIESEAEGRITFYNMMIAEGFIALIWAAATMALLSVGAERGGITMALTESGWTYMMQGAEGLQPISATSVVGVICRNMLGRVGGAAALAGVIVLPVTSGDTALRSLRLMLSDTIRVKQDTAMKRELFSLPIFALVYLCLIGAKIDPAGFQTIWRYFGWSNQTLAVFALSCITIYLMRNGRERYLWMPLLPLAFYTFVTASYLLSAEIAFALPMPLSYALGAAVTALVAAAVLRHGSRKGISGGAPAERE